MFFAVVINDAVAVALLQLLCCSCFVAVAIIKAVDVIDVAVVVSIDVLHMYVLCVINLLALLMLLSMF